MNRCLFIPTASLLPFALLPFALFAAGCGGSQPPDAAGAPGESAPATVAAPHSAETPSANEGKGESNVSAAAPAEIPDAPVSGTIAGKPFKLDAAELNNGQLTLKQGKEFFPDLAVTVFLFLEDGEKLAGKSWTIDKPSGFKNPHLHLKHKKEDAGFPETTIVTENYSLALHFGQADRGEITGRVSLQVLEEPGAKLAGTFTADLGIDLSQPPQEWERPWSLTRIKLPDDNEHKLAAGYAARTDSGEWESNMAGTNLKPDREGHASSTTFKPRVTSVAASESLGLHGRHIRLSPGQYVFYVREGENYVVWKTAEITADSELELTFEVDPSDAGKLTVEAPNADPNERVQVVPLTKDGQPPLELTGKFDYHRLGNMIGAAKVEQGRAVFEGVAPGRYRVHLGEKSAEVEVAPGEEAAVTLGKDV